MLRALPILLAALVFSDVAEAASLQVGGQLGAGYQLYDGRFAGAGMLSIHAGWELGRRHRFGGQIAGFFRGAEGGATEVGGLALMFIYRYRTGWLPKYIDPYFEFGAGPAFVGGPQLNGVFALSGVFGMRIDIGVALLANVGLWGWYVFNRFFALTPAFAVGVEF